MIRNHEVVARKGRLLATALTVLALAAASVAACGVDMEEPVRAEGSTTPASTESTARAVPGNGASNTAVLVSNRQPARLPVDSAPRPKVSYEDAERVFRTGDYDEAADLFEAYAQRKPDNPWGHYMLGISAWRAEDYARAEAALRRTLEEAPQHSKGMLNLARVLLDQGEAVDAIEYAEQVVDLGPASGDAWRVLGNAQAELGTVDDAVQSYREALVLDHEDAWSMNNLALLMIRDGRYREALGPLARATELRPDIAVFQNNLGIALERNGYSTGAAEAFRAALDADHDYVKAQVSLKRVESRLATTPSVPIDLAVLAHAFADEVSQWQEQGVRSDRAPSNPGETTGEPADTVGLTRPIHQDDTPQH